MKPTSEELRQALANFTGTEQWYQHSMNRLLTYTDGVRYFAVQAGAYWLLDIIATEVFPLMQREGFVCVSAVSSDNQATLTADDGNGNGLWERKIEYTDLPEWEWKFYLTDNVLLLPGEY